MPRDAGFTMTDAPLILSAAAPMGSAREMVARIYQDPSGRTLHHAQDTFRRWTGTHYAEEPPECIRSAVYQFLDGAVVQTKDGTAPFNPNRSKTGDVQAALAAITQLPAGTSAPAWIDMEPLAPATELLACSNGLLHLPTRRMFDHTAGFYNENAVSYPFDPDAPEPVAWFNFLHELWPEDPASITTLQELFGLLLTTDTSQQKAFLLIGPKRSGKGTIARVLTALLGKENVEGPTLFSLTQNFGLAPLIGKPLAIVSDARLGTRADASVVVERLLAITGEDSITIDRKYRDPWTGRLPARFVILTNELPRLADASGALAGRFIILRLSKSFYGNEDTTLTGKLLRELPGILGWALTGYDRLRTRGHFVQPATADQMVRDLDDLASPVGAFVREWCDVGPAHSVACDTLFNAWLGWCREQNRDHPGTVQTFGRDLAAAIPDISTTRPRDESGARERRYTGIRLTPVTA